MSAPESKADLIRRTVALLERNERARKLVEREEQLSEAITALGEGNGGAPCTERDKLIMAALTRSSKR
jgi:hypothetical protein